MRFVARFLEIASKENPGLLVEGAKGLLAWQYQREHGSASDPSR